MAVTNSEIPQTHCSATSRHGAATLYGWFDLKDEVSQIHETLTLMQPHVAHPEAEGMQQAKDTCLALGGDNYCLDTAIQAAIVGQPRWSDTELQDLALTGANAKALAIAYRRFGTEFLHHLKGAFALVVIDLRERRLLAAIDRFGQHTLYFSRVPKGGIVFGTSYGPVLRHPQTYCRLHNQAMYNYVYFHMVPSPGCIYEDHGKLASGHLLEYRNGEIKTRSYWQPRFSEISSKSDSELHEQLQYLIRESVRRASRSQTGAFLSGGLDSSTVAGTLSRLDAEPTHTYSIGFDAQGYDEIEYARIAAEHFQTIQHEYYVTPQDVVEAVPIIAANLDEPFGNSSVIPAFYCAKMAAHDGIKRLLAGDGGDELFAGNERYAKQLLFEQYFRLPATLRRYLMEPVAGIMSAWPAPLYKVQRYIKQAQIPLPDRLQTYNFLHRHDPASIFADDFMATVSQEEPLALQRAIYQTPDDASALNRMLYLDWQHTLADNDLRKVISACSTAGVEVSFPLLDDDLVEFSCLIPSRLKLKGRNLRDFYKQAMRNFLPAAILKKSKHGFGLPFGVWMLSYDPLRQLAYDNLSNLKKRHYFKASFIDQAVTLHKEGHAAYYGELVWILMMLELWLSSHDTYNGN